MPCSRGRVRKIQRVHSATWESRMQYGTMNFHIIFVVVVVVRLVVFWFCFVGILRQLLST